MYVFPILSYGAQIWSQDNFITKQICTGRNKQFGLRLVSRDNHHVELSSERNTFQHFIHISLFKHSKKQPSPVSVNVKYNFRRSHVMSLPSKKFFFKREVFYSSIKLYNNFPQNLRRETNLVKLKNLINHLLIENPSARRNCLRTS